MRPGLPAHLADRDFFIMGEVVGITQVPAHTLRYWESQFGAAFKPARRSSGHRRFTRGDLETILSIKDLLQRRKMTVAGAKRELKKPRLTVKAGEAPSDAALKILREVKKEVQALLAEMSK